MTFSLSCNPLKMDNNKVYIEKIPKEYINDENRFNVDNKIYMVGNNFLYEFQRFNNNNEIIDSPISKIEFIVLEGLDPFKKNHPDYSQTVFKMNYYDDLNNVISVEKTGLIENDKNIWLHPPRIGIMNVLQMNAFPYIKLNENLNRWEWQLEASYKSYKKIKLTHKYERKAKETLIFNNKKIICEVIESNTISSIKKSSAKFYFNSEYGFVKLIFRNFDSSSYVFKLSKANLKNDTNNFE